MIKDNRELIKTTAKDVTVKAFDFAVDAVMLGIWSPIKEFL